VVGPRYIPGNPVGKQAGGWAEDTDRVPDASRITPNVAVPDTRAGHDINVEVKLDAGLPIDALQSATHDVDIARTGPSGAVVRLRNKQALPNKDFILKYDVAGRTIEDAVLAHADGRGGFFSLILQPPERAGAVEITPKELVFVLDTSGSMSGFPIEKAKEIVRLVKDSKKKAQASIQGDVVRITSKDRDTLQEIIALLRGKDMGLDLQFTNYRTN